MVDTRGLKDYIKLGDLDEGDKIRFATAGAIIERDFAKQGEDEDIKPVLEMQVELNGQEAKKMTLNGTTISILNEAWTRDTENWVGKIALAEKRKIMSFGKWIDIIVLEPAKDIDPPSPEPEAQAPTPQVEPDPNQKNQSGVDFCKCEGSKPLEGLNEANQQVCSECDKPMVAWDE